MALSGLLQPQMENRQQQPAVVMLEQMLFRRLAPHEAAIIKVRSVGKSDTEQKEELCRAAHLLPLLLIGIIGTHH